MNPLRVCLRWEAREPSLCLLSTFVKKDSEPINNVLDIC